MGIEAWFYFDPKEALPSNPTESTDVPLSALS